MKKIYLTFLSLFAFVLVGQTAQVNVKATSSMAISLVNVEDGGTTNQNVTAFFNYADVTFYNRDDAYEGSWYNGQTFTQNGSYSLSVYDANSEDFVTVNFTIDKTRPIIINLYGVTDGGTTSGTVKVCYHLLYPLDITNVLCVSGGYHYSDEFTSGSVYEKDGIYYFIVCDIEGNVAQASFTIL